MSPAEGIEEKNVQAPGADTSVGSSKRKRNRERTSTAATGLKTTTVVEEPKHAVVQNGRQSKETGVATVRDDSGGRAMPADTMTPTTSSKTNGIGAAHPPPPVIAAA
jgi:hypothetical protein